MLPKNNEIIFVYEMSPKIGLGHAKRTTVLDHFFSTYEFNTKRILLQNFEVGLIQNNSIVLFDLPFSTHLDIEIIDALKLKKCFIVFLDNFQSDIYADLRINIYNHFDTVGQRVLSGFEYVLIREEIKSAERKIIKNRVVVQLGGADVKRQSLTVANHLAKKGFDVFLIWGPLAESSETHGLNPRIKFFKNPDNYPELLASAEWAVTNGAGSLFEAQFLEIPTWVLPQTKEEEVIASYFVKHELVLGTGGELFDYAFKFRKIDFIKSPIDGDGCLRIYNSIIKERIENDG